MQLAPLAGNRLLEVHHNLFDTVAAICKGSDWTPGIIYINGAAWVLNLNKKDGTVIEVVADIGDRDSIVLKVQALL